MIATLGGLEFVGDGDDTATYTLDADGLGGWFGGVEMRHDTIPRPSSHGDFDAPGFLSGRIITLSGLILTADDSAFEAAIKALEALLADGSAGELEVQQTSGTYTAEVRRHGAPDIAVVVYGRVGRYQLQFWSPDPRRYGVTHTYGPGAVVAGVEQDGNFPAWPVLTVEGSAGGGYTVTGPGSKLITVTEPLVSGNPHTIDLSTGGLYVDGVRVVGGVSVYQPWSVPVGSSVSVSVSAGTVTVEVRDTFI